MTDVSGKRILLGITGGIAAYKAAELTRLFVKAGADVQVVMTEAACRFVTPTTIVVRWTATSVGPNGDVIRTHGREVFNRI